MKASSVAQKLYQNLYVRGSIAVALVMMFQNCGGFSAGLNYDMTKASLLANGQIFAAANEIIMIGDACYETTPTGAQTEVACPTPTPRPSATPTPLPTPRSEDPEATATPTPNPTPSPSPSPNPTATPMVMEDPPTTIPMPSYCATGYTRMTGYNLRTAGANLKIAILPDGPFAAFAKDGEFLSSSVQTPYNSADAENQLQHVKPLCEWSDPQTSSDLLNRSLTIRNLKAHCPNLAPGRYTLSVVRAAQTTNYQRNLLYSAFNGHVQNLPIDWATYYEGDVERAAGRVVINIEPSSTGGVRVASIAGAQGIPTVVPMVVLDTYGQPGCEYSASPLIVQMKRGSQLRLTSQDKGVKFDILGLLAQPVAHTKELISWLMPEGGDENYFITLPNAAGEVNGIEEMFGDNTSGPDGKFASNGYEALRKWDGRKADGSFDSRKRDGFIRKSDEVYSKLRFWKDTNFDGVAQKSELYTLEELNVEFIDLKADANFMEVDAHGNRITLKSAVQTNDGELHVMYDLWFALKH
jgi:hypothetical protein